MPLPRGDEYNVAVQNPRISFNDEDLRLSTVETTPLGLPKPYSGGFTITYKLSNGQKSWAVRCFHRDISDLKRRYQAIEAFLSKNNSKYFVEAKYLEEGIKVNGRAYPIIKMQWLEGEPLNVYLSKNYKQKTKVEKLLSDFVNLINELERYGIAHGDLQHGNIIVKNDSLYLIDYDGMYLPELASLQTNEIGHINYQHPKRSASHYNQYIDRFSAIVIYIGLKAITLNPSLWEKYDNSENILFKSQDFVDFQNSSLIKDLSAISEIKPLVERLIGCCHLDFEKVPNLKDFLSGNFNYSKSGNFTYNKSAAGTFSINRSQYLILNANEVNSILKHFGKKVEVVGKITAIYSSTTQYGAPYTFLNFGGVYPHHTFTIVLWQEGLDSLKANRISPESFVGKWVSVTGVISSYKNKPQTVVELATQIQILSGETEANQRLTFKSASEQSIQAPVTLEKVIDKEVDIFNKLYQNKPVSTPPKKIEKTPTPTSTSTPSTPSYSSTSQTTKSTGSKSSNKNGCLVPIIFAVIGAAAVMGSASGGKLWFVGGIIGGILGARIQSWFKS